MPPNRKVALKRWRRPGRKALLTFAGLFTVIRVDKCLPNEAPQTKLAASSVLPVPVQRANAGYGHRGRVCVTRPALVLAARSWLGAFACSTQLTSASNNPCG